MCLVVAYDGTDFHGFQRQPGQRTVQGELERAASEMAGHPVSVRGAGRTDAGVHALGQVVAFDSARLISERGWMLGLNTKLPDDIRVQHARACAPGYHPRFDSVGKRYRYLLQLGEAKNPLLRHRAWQLGKWRLDVARMREAARALIGTHDFRAFRAADDERENTVRSLWAIEITEGFGGDRSLIALEFHGNAFMKNMVRILTGTLVDVGIGRLSVEAMGRLLGAEAQRSDAGQTAPPQGLTLVEVELGRNAHEGASAPGPAPDSEPR